MSAARQSAGELVVFLGPTLEEKAARKVARLTLLPPARQGDVWRALQLGPSALVLIDGVFEAQPSVWHAELLAALEAGVAVFGASSMGALRAAELGAFGMRGVGEIYEGFRSGKLVDDAEVALLHASAEHHFRPLTVPLVNVRHAAATARRQGVLTRGEALQLVRLAEETFYQERTWTLLERSLVASWRPATLQRWKDFASSGLPDLKRTDALKCLEEAARWIRSAQRPPQAGGPPGRPSSLVRRRRLLADSRTAEALGTLSASRSAHAFARAGLTRSVLAATARSLGLHVSASELRAEELSWRKRLGARPGDRGFYRRLGMDEGDGRRLCEEVILAKKLLERSARLFPDALSFEEALANEARWTGAWPGLRRGEGTS